MPLPADLLGGATPYERRTQPEYSTDESSVRSGVPLTPLHEDAVAQYLESYGYYASGPGTWKIEITVNNSSVMAGHTWYLVKFTITIEGAIRTQWTVPRRLSHFREGLYDHVLHDLPKAVKHKHFQNAPFALRGGPPGTGKRLHAWCEALSDVINEGAAPPSLVARCLRWGERESSKSWSLTGLSREYTGASREGTWTNREGTWASREGTEASREGTWASREYSVESGASKRAPASREGSCTTTALGEVERATGELERTSLGVTLRFGTPLPPVPPAGVPRYLEKFGYGGYAESIWPNFSISVGNKFEMFAHNWYCVHVSLSNTEHVSESGKDASWTVPRRLCHFEDGLAHYVKSLPATVYKEHFRSVSFPLRGGTEKLNSWCLALSAAINSGQAPPAFVALCLRWAEHPTAAVLGKEAYQNVEIGPLESTEVLESNEVFQEPDQEDILRAVELAKKKDASGVGDINV